MKTNNSEKGQALVVIALAAVVLFGFAALAIDGSRVYSDRRKAQNAADTAALAGALAYSNGDNITSTAESRATSNGYDGGDTNDVTVTITDVASGICPSNIGKEIRVDITSNVGMTFARVIGKTQINNYVHAITRACGSYTGALFNGNAIVSLAPNGTGFDGHGTPIWNITGGGVSVNSSSTSAAICGGNAGVNAPSVTAVGGTDFGCHTVNIGSTTQNTGAQLSYSSYSSLFPRQPACNGTATFSGGQWRPQAGADGSKAQFTINTPNFAPGLYCITDSPGPFHELITGTEVTFYAMAADFNISFNGGGGDGGFEASAPTSGEYKGVLLYVAPQVRGNTILNTQSIDLRGNGSAGLVGTIIAPSATVTMFGNSGTGAVNSQIIAYRVDTGGTADITIAYNANDNYQPAIPATLALLK